MEQSVENAMLPMIQPARSAAIALWIVFLCSAITPSSSLWTLTLAARIIVRNYNPAAEGYFGNDTVFTPAPSWAAARGHTWVVTRPILGGLHHEYCLAKVA
jgi:hypothetical protein